MYDVIAGQNASFKEMYRQTSARLENIKSLQARINAAADPGDKLDLANRLHIEQGEGGAFVYFSPPKNQRRFAPFGTNWIATSLRASQ
ncbi:MAG: type IV secretion system protein [Azoarcus sp.]|jgi:hypothetical protein|nr:type IV secretion system protein [Azoarcus sp.]